VRALALDACTVTVGINLPALSSALTSFYTNSTAINAFLGTFNTTVTALMTYPELLMWCACFACEPARFAGTHTRLPALRKLLTLAVPLPRPLLCRRRTVGNEISLGSSSGLTQSTGSLGWSGTVSLGWANMWSLVGTLAAIIHALDPYHPVGSCTPNINTDGAPACGSHARVSCADAVVRMNVHLRVQRNSYVQRLHALRQQPGHVRR
jgi:hypothetical protein